MDTQKHVSRLLFSLFVPKIFFAVVLFTFMYENNVELKLLLCVSSKCFAKKAKTSQWFGPSEVLSQTSCSGAVGKRIALKSLVCSQGNTTP